MYDLAKMFLHCLNHWKLETPTARKQTMSSDDISAYKVILIDTTWFKADLKEKFFCILACVLSTTYQYDILGQLHPMALLLPCSCVL